ncbi:hypothetical protein [Azospirillum rugosum]|uniref:Type VI secretion system secreted protein VgrG n=1 Tax=Azospirillum rugosum TaxID=416170 RepID=A0ABS4SEU6_9PROT|nr:hypothetical protein [Azospirillum rugosum]MBP2290588.1 type VI secretion system secreted protein VgrG [Azospirillum rugosum]MDQ0525476.1 type VI secretion system secreted protein VgrG [Azospirillum rugosum]
MRSKLWLAVVPALALGLAACDEQSAKNDSGNTNTTSTAERPATTPPPPAGTPGQNASGVTGNAPPTTPAPTTTPAPSAAPGGSNTNSQ